jgi:hypothetical protein
MHARNLLALLTAIVALPQLGVVPTPRTMLHIMSVGVPPRPRHARHHLRRRLCAPPLMIGIMPARGFAQLPHAR